MNRIITIAVSFLIAVSIFSGCGSASDNKPAETKSESAVSDSSTKETNKVIETTPDGGTVEEDADGNIVKKDKNGKINSVEDKNGKPIDVKTYIASHPEAKESAAGNSTSSKTSKSSKSSNSSKTKSKKQKSNSSSKSSKSSNNSKNSKSSKSDESNEGEIPRITVSGPEDHYDEELPVF